MARQEQQRPTPAPLKPEYWSVSEMADYVASGIFLKPLCAKRLREFEIGQLDNGKSIDEIVVLKSKALEWYIATRDYERFNFGLTHLEKATDDSKAFDVLFSDLKNADSFLEGVAKPRFTQPDPHKRPKVDWENFRDVATQRLDKIYTSPSEKKYSMRELDRLLQATLRSPSAESLERYLGYYDELSTQGSQDIFHALYKVEGNFDTSAKHMEKLKPFERLLNFNLYTIPGRTVFKELNLQTKEDVHRLEQLLQSLHGKNFDMTNIFNDRFISWFQDRAKTSIANARAAKDPNEPLGLKPDRELVHTPFSPLRQAWEIQFCHVDWEIASLKDRIYWGDHEKDVTNAKASVWKNVRNTMWQEYEKEVFDAVLALPDLTPAQAWVSGKVIVGNLAQFTDLEHYEKTVKVPVAWKKVEEEHTASNHGDGPDDVFTDHIAVPTAFADYTFTFAKPTTDKILEFIKDPAGLVTEANKLLEDLNNS